MGAIGFILRLGAILGLGWALAGIRAIYLDRTHEKRPLEDPEGRSDLL